MEIKIDRVVEIKAWKETQGKRVCEIEEREMIKLFTEEVIEKSFKN